MEEALVPAVRVLRYEQVDSKHLELWEVDLEMMDYSSESVPQVDATHHTITVYVFWKSQKAAHFWWAPRDCKPTPNDSPESPDTVPDCRDIAVLIEFARERDEEQRRFVRALAPTVDDLGPVLAKQAAYIAPPSYWVGSEHPDCLLRQRPQGMCGSCWALALARMLGVRTCIASKHHASFWPSVALLLNCAAGRPYVCSGAGVEDALDVLRSFGVVSDAQAPEPSRLKMMAYAYNAVAHRVFGSSRHPGNSYAEPDCKGFREQLGARRLQPLLSVNFATKYVELVPGLTLTAMVQRELQLRGPVGAAFPSTVGLHEVVVDGWLTVDDVTYWQVVDSFTFVLWEARHSDVSVEPQAGWQPFDYTYLKTSRWQSSDFMLYSALRPQLEEALLLAFDFTSTEWGAQSVAFVAQYPTALVDVFTALCVGVFANDETSPVLPCAPLFSPERWDPSGHKAKNGGKHAVVVEPGEIELDELVAQLEAPVRLRLRMLVQRPAPGQRAHWLASTALSDRTYRPSESVTA